MPDKRPLTEAEKSLWKHTMRDVVPLSEDSHAALPLHSKPRSAVKRKRQISAVHDAETLSYLMPASIPSRPVDASTRKRVETGRYLPSARLDLHGLTLAEAYAALSGFISSHYYQQHRCVLVITGKSGKTLNDDTLQAEVPRWLSLSQMSSMVTYHAPAQPKHGGDGARYILLKRHT